LPDEKTILLGFDNQDQSALYDLQIEENAERGIQVTRQEHATGNDFQS
jgi:hypothetical protein